MPIRIRVSHNLGSWPLLRQTPGARGAWGDCAFFLANSRYAGRCDFWLVFEGLTRVEQASLAPERTIFVTGEPEAFHRYRPEFLDQFGLVVTSQRRIQGANVIHTQPGLPWHAGVRRPAGEGGAVLCHDTPRFNYDDLRSTTTEKVYDLSVVCSAKAEVEGHHLRLELVRRLKEHFGDRLHWFGRGFDPIEDKWDAIAPYRFHISLESAAEPDYWSEKLADAYLGRAFPFYAGCPNLDAYFDGDAFVRVDPREPGKAIAAIEHGLAEGLTPARVAAVARAREKILDTYNLFPMIVGLLDRCADGVPQSVVLRPESDFRSPLRRFRRIATRMRWT